MPVSRPRAMLIAGKVERQAEQVVAQRVDDELIDLVAALDRHAAHDGGRALVMGEVAVVVEADGIEERLDQTELFICKSG